MESEYAVILTDHIYISTLTDLSSRMLEVDVHPGQYKFTPFAEGYVFAKDGYTPTIKDVVYVFNTRNNDRGLGLSYHDGDSKDDHLRIYNTFIRHDLDEEYLKRIWEYKFGYVYDEDEESSYDEEEEKTVKSTEKEPPHRRPVKRFPDYHNIPVLFYLNSKPTDLSKITLELAGKRSDKTVIWNVKDGATKIGLAVNNCNTSKYSDGGLYNMVGDQAVVGILNNAQAFGNFSNRDNPDPIEDYIFIDYDCKFQPCSCKVKY